MLATLLALVEVAVGHSWVPVKILEWLNDAALDTWL